MSLFLRIFAVLLCLPIAIVFGVVGPLTTYLDYNLALNGKVVQATVIETKPGRSKTGRPQYAALAEYTIDGKQYRARLSNGDQPPAELVEVRYAPVWPKYAVIGGEFPIPRVAPVLTKLLLCGIFALASTLCLVRSIQGRRRSSLQNITK